MQNDPLEGFRTRYEDVHPLIFARSAERARTPGELFDILEEIPESYPIVWDEALRRWVHTDDIWQTENYIQAEEAAASD